MSQGTLQPIQFGMGMLAEEFEPTPAPGPPVPPPPAVKDNASPDKAPKLIAKDWRKTFRARLREVNKELKRLKALEAEKAQLERFISAAEKPQAPLRSIRNTG